MKGNEERGIYSSYQSIKLLQVDPQFIDTYKELLKIKLSLILLQFYVLF
jgi:hypothetical protein